MYVILAGMYRMVKNVGGEKLGRIWQITSNLPKKKFTAFNRIVYGFCITYGKTYGLLFMLICSTVY